MTQDALPGLHARRTDPITSQEAGARVHPRSAMRVLRVIQVATTAYEGDLPFTDGMLAGWCDDERNIVARRRKDLVDLGFVQQVVSFTGPLYQMGPRGRNELLWCLTVDGWAHNTGIDDDDVPDHVWRMT